MGEKYACDISQCEGSRYLYVPAMAAACESFLLGLVACHVCELRSNKLGLGDDYGFGYDLACVCATLSTPNA
jgi:hypothetical protein